jgi:hypothetical protein
MFRQSLHEKFTLHLGIVIGSDVLTKISITTDARHAHVFIIMVKNWIS